MIQSKAPASLAVAVETVAIAGEADERVTNALGNVSAALGESISCRGEIFAQRPEDS